jgi:L-malate glycosyltransferase
MQKIRVMFVVLQLDAGGSERVVLELAQNLDPLQYEIYVAAFKGGVLKAPLKKICKDIFFIEKGSGFDISAMFHLAELVRKNGIDVVNAHHYMPCFYSFLGTRILNRKKLIYTEHSVPEVEAVGSGIHGKIFWWMLFQINAVIGVSNEIIKNFKHYYPRHEKKFLTVLNGVDTEKFASGKNRKDVRAQWGLTADNFVVGTIANFRRVKNHACLVRAASRLKDSHPQLRLLFVGKGFSGDPENSEDEVRELIQQLDLKDKVFLAGYQENIPEMLSSFDVFCLPSISEGLPVSVLEAMAAGVPVVGSQVQGIKEVIKNRETGLLFLPNNDIQLACLLKEIISSKSFAQYLANQAIDYVQRVHSKKGWVQQISNIFMPPR